MIFFQNTRRMVFGLVWVVLLVITAAAMIVTLAYYYELPWPCAFEPVDVWSTHSCGVAVLNSDGFAPLGIPLSIFLGISAVFVLAADMNMVIQGKTENAGALLASRLSAWILLACAIFMVYVFYWKIGIPCVWCKLMATLSVWVVLVHELTLGSLYKSFFGKRNTGLVIVVSVVAISLALGLGMRALWLGVPEIVSRDAISKISKGMLEEGVDHHLGKKDADLELVMFVDPSCQPSRTLVAQALSLASGSMNAKIVIRPYSFGKDERLIKIISNVEQIKYSRDYWEGISKMFGVGGKSSYISVTGAHGKSPVVTATEILSDNLKMTGTPVVLAIRNGQVNVIKRQDLSYYIR
jgi:hypothetical protein